MFLFVIILIFFIFQVDQADYTGLDSGPAGTIEKKIFFIEKSMQTNEARIKNIDQG